MAARDAARPALTVLQLDTRFPRLPGDVGCPETYCGPVEILRVAGASVARIVQDRPDLIDIAPFETAARAARGDVVVTSCGFLAHWQAYLAERCPRPFVASSLRALSRADWPFGPDEVMTLTFDARALTAMHMPAAYLSSVVGLPPGCELRRVISGNLAALDPARASAEVVEIVRRAQRPSHRVVLLECTNLPPHAAAIRQATGLPVHSILTEIERLRPGTVRPDWL